MMGPDVVAAHRRPRASRNLGEGDRQGDRRRGRRGCPEGGRPRRVRRCADGANSQRVGVQVFEVVPRRRRLACEARRSHGEHRGAASQREPAADVEPGTHCASAQRLSPPDALVGALAGGAEQRAEVQRPPRVCTLVGEEAGEGAAGAKLGARPGREEAACAVRESPTRRRCLSSPLPRALGPGGQVSGARGSDPADADGDGGAGGVLQSGAGH
mmetsp:Transcript_87394/g.252325  ORF Transcript_87394/g.252325 Transcript_87394/m.252325 type:complete len:214 (-) Transcript_87394:1062-1703(-)